MQSTRVKALICIGAITNRILGINSQAYIPANPPLVGPESLFLPVSPRHQVVFSPWIGHESIVQDGHKWAQNAELRTRTKKQPPKENGVKSKGNSERKRSPPLPMPFYRRHSASTPAPTRKTAGGLSSSHKPRPIQRRVFLPLRLLAAFLRLLLLPLRILLAPIIIQLRALRFLLRFLNPIFLIPLLFQGAFQVFFLAFNIARTILMILLRALLRRRLRKDEHEKVDVITIYEEEAEHIRPTKLPHHKKGHKHMHDEEWAIRRQDDVGNVPLDGREAQLVVATPEERLHLEQLLEQGRRLLDQLNRQIAGDTAPAALGYDSNLFQYRPQTPGGQHPMAVMQPYYAGAALLGPPLASGKL